MLKQALSLIMACLAIAAAGCGGDDDDDGGAATNATETAAEVSPADQAAIEKAVDRYLAADTPAEVCDSITTGLESAIARRRPTSNPREPSSGGCEKAIELAAKKRRFGLEKAEGEVQEVAVDGDRAAARILNQKAGPEPYPVFLAKTGGKWLVHADHAVPPDFSELAAQVAE